LKHLLELGGLCVCIELQNLGNWRK